MKVRAIRSFDHNGSRRPGEVFEVSDKYAGELQNAGLVEIARPTMPAGQPPIASPAGQALPRRIARNSARKKSSSLTQVSE